MKEFIIIGNQNAITYKEIFPLIKENKLWAGFNFNKTMEFVLPNDYKKWDRIENGRKIGKVNGICWFTNLPVTDKEPLVLSARYSHEKYQKYDNYDAIEVGALKDIPFDYSGVMGVPVSFLDKYCPEQFEIINGVGRYAIIENTYTNPKGTYGTAVNGKHNFFRILIRKRSPNS